MKALTCLLSAFLVLSIGLVDPAASAEVVGRITQVEGQVDFLKGGKLPAQAAKAGDGVEVGDVLRTKSLSKAQVTFVDNSVITVSPGTRFAVEEFAFDAGKGKRNAVLQLFQGLAHVVVNKIFQTAEPDFVVKTHTAVMGVRGTDFGVRLHPNSSTILNFEGKTQVGNIFPEVGDLLLKKAHKVAFSWGGATTVQLNAMQATTVFAGLAPTVPVTISQQERQQFMGQVGGMMSSGKSGGGSQTAGGGTSGSGSSSSSSSTGGGSDSSTGSSSSDSSLSSYSSSSLGGPDSGLGTPTPATTAASVVTNPVNNTIAVLDLVTIPPSGPGESSGGTGGSGSGSGGGGSPQTSSFSQTSTVPYLQTATNPGVLASTSPGSGTRTGVYPGTFTTAGSFVSVLNTPGVTWVPGYTWNFTTTIADATASGYPGSTLTGTMNVSMLDSPGGTRFYGSGVPYSLDPNGNLSFSLAGFTGVGLYIPSTATITTGTITQTGTGATPAAPTYSFYQTGYSAWQSAANGTVTATGWGQRTGSWPTGTFTSDYYTSSSTGTRTLVQGSSPGISTGTSSGTLYGTVSGALGSTLTGTGTFMGSNSFGEASNYSGTVTIDPQGNLTFTYANGTISSARRTLSASGTNTYTLGTYFTQSVDGAVIRSSNAPYDSAILTNIEPGLWGGGTRSGPTEVKPGSFNLSVSGAETSYWRYSFLPSDMGNLTGEMQGVVNTSTGVGAMTIFPNDNSFTSSLPLRFQPGSYLFLGRGGGLSGPIVSDFKFTDDFGSAYSTAYATYYQNGRFNSSHFDLNQTVPQTTVANPVTATYNFQETFGVPSFRDGASALMISSSSPGSPATTYGLGWGERTFLGTTSTPATSVYNTAFAGYDTGAWNATTGTLPNYYGSSLAAGTTVITGSATGILGKTLSGNMSFYGSLLNGASFSYQGTVTIDNNGVLRFAYGGSGYTSTWTYPGGVSGTASGTLTQYPGYYFEQTMTNANGQVERIGPRRSTLLLPVATSTGGNRDAVYEGSFGSGSVDGSISLRSTVNNTIPVITGTTADLTLKGVVTTSDLGACSGVGSLYVNFPEGLGLTLPGIVSITPGAPGNSYFSPVEVFVQNSPAIQVVNNPVGQSYVSQGPIFNFSETIQGFRISTNTGATNLANIEGYGWGQRLNTNTANPLPSSYLGAFVSQDLGTRASAAPMSTNWLGLTGTLSATLTGTTGNTLSGQGTFSGTTSSGTNFGYQGVVSLAANGQLVFTYSGSWNTASGQTGTGSGTMQQVPGTYFTETTTVGTINQASSTQPLGTNYPTGSNLNYTSVTDATPFSSSRVMDPNGASPTTTATTSSLAGSSSSVSPTPITGSGTAPASLTIQGVVASSSADTKWGVATANLSSSMGGSGSITGTVAIDSASKLTGQFVDTPATGPNAGSALALNVVSVPAASGQTTSSFTQAASGTFIQTTNTDRSVAYITAPLTGTGTGSVLSGPINGNLAITSTALQPNSYAASSTGPITVNTVGVVAGPPGGVQTGVSTTQAVKTSTTDGASRVMNVVGAPTVLPAVPAVAATPAVPPVMTTPINGLNPTSTGVTATQTGGTVMTK